MLTSRVDILAFVLLLYQTLTRGLFPLGRTELGIRSAGGIPVDYLLLLRHSSCTIRLLSWVNLFRDLQPTAVLSFHLPPATHTSRTCHTMDMQIAL